MTDPEELASWLNDVANDPVDGPLERLERRARRGTGR